MKTVLMATFFMLVAQASADAAIVVTNPPAGTTNVAAGDEFATQVVGNAWNMDSPTDFDPGESSGLTAPSIAGGEFTTTITTPTSGGTFFILAPGWGSKTIPHWNGELYGVATSHYHNITIKMRQTGGTGTQPTRIVFYRDADGANESPAAVGSSFFKYLPQNTAAGGPWTIASWDLLTEAYDRSNTAYFPWTTWPAVHGISINIASDTVHGVGTPSSSLEVQWIRVSTPLPFNVTWTDAPVATYDITAIASDGTRFLFNATPVSGTSYAADIALLAPGDYTIEVKNHATSSMARSGTLHINTPPQVQVTKPSIRGEQSLSYAAVVDGNQWGPLTATDFWQIGDFASTSFNTPVGSFYGRPSGGDTNLWFTTNAAIDTNLYRSVCVTFEVFGTRDVGLGSIARFFWGVVSNSMSGTYGFVLYNNTVPNEYCFEDLKQIPLDPLSPPAPWVGQQNFFRFDPDEFGISSTCTSTPSPQNCHDVRLDSLYLSPFASAAPAYQITWTLADPNTNGASVNLLLNTSRTSDLSQSIPIATLPYATGPQQYHFVTRHSIPNGTYYVGIQASDGLNTVLQYASGPILVDSSDVIFNNAFEP